MEARFGAQVQHFYRDFGKRSVEWDLNDWKWDGDLFIANPINSVPSKEFFPLGSGIPGSNSSSSCSEDVDLGIGRGKREFEKRSRPALVENDDDEGGTLSLKLGGQQQLEGTSGKKFKVGSNRAVCQVEGCAADLTNAKDYHRRHKVCEMHSKATKALVGNVMQRFCQQCSRFHILQEFDDGKRSCRRRLAGHNKRRRKTNPAAAATNGNSLNDDQTTGYLLISLLRILSNIHANRSDEGSDQDLISHLLRSLANQPGQHGVSPGIVSALLSSGPQGLSGAFNQHSSASELPQQRLHEDDARGAVVKITSSPRPSIQNSPPAFSEVTRSPPAQIKINNFDLNDIYIDSDDGMDDVDRLPARADNVTTSLDCPSWAQQDSHQSSPPQMSRNSDSVSGQSPSSSSGDAQSRTDRIVFKLFGKVPSDFPLVMRAQILDWLSHIPTDIESYIRPGCVVLTIYLRQADAVWEQLSCNLSSSLSSLLDVLDDTFWTSGWIYIRVQNQIAFVYDGQVVIETSLPLTRIGNSRILSVKPIAVSASERVQFSVKGINLYQPATRLLCALEGKYLVQGATHELVDTIEENDELQCVNLSCSIPEVTGRGFMEVEDNGLSGSFFPFIVAEDDVCSEIRMLEGQLEFTENDIHFASGSLEARKQAVEFIHEMGWLLHRSQLKSRLGQLDPTTEHFALNRFKWLMEFSMDRDWCAVVRKLLDVSFDGNVGVGEHPSVDHALSNMGLLHRAVRRNSRPLVELLLKYVPRKDSEKLEPQCGTLGGGHEIFLFRPDASGPAGLTPLHIAAGKDGSEDVLDALTDDPQMVGMEAWKTTRDSTGFTPEDYARLRGHYSYIHMVQRKINKRSGVGQVVLDIPDVLSKGNVNEKENNELSATFEIEGSTTIPRLQSCKLCDKKLVYGTASRSIVYRPAMLSMVAIAAVCVCVALLFKSSPVVPPAPFFRWESLGFGTV